MSLEIINVEQGSDEWHKLRAEHIRTASRTPIVMGLSPFSNKEKLAQDIKFGIKQYYSKAMRQGNELEDMVREKANEYFEDVFQPMVGIRDGLLASLDGINFDEDTVIEIKVSEHTYNDIKNGSIPEHYLWQVKHQMQVFKQVKRGYLVAYSVENDEIAVSAHITTDDNDFLKITDAWDKFGEFMQDYELPEILDIENKEAVDLADELKEINDAKKDLADREKEIKEKLSSLATGQKTQIGSLTISKQKGRVSYDYAKLVKDLKIEDKLIEYKKEAKESLVFRFRG